MPYNFSFKIYNKPLYGVDLQNIDSVFTPEQPVFMPKTRYFIRCNIHWDRQVKHGQWKLELNTARKYFIVDYWGYESSNGW